MSTVRDRKTVLVVDDVSALVTLMDRILAAEGYQVLGATDPVAAIELVEGLEGAIDLLITDVALPTIDGPTLAKRVSARYPDIRIVFMSGHIDEAILRGQVAAGSCIFLAKPFEREVLVRTVRDQIGPPSP